MERRLFFYFIWVIISFFIFILVFFITAIAQITPFYLYLVVYLPFISISLYQSQSLPLLYCLRISGGWVYLKGFLLLCYLGRYSCYLKCENIWDRQFYALSCFDNQHQQKPLYKALLHWWQTNSIKDRNRFF